MAGQIASQPPARRRGATSGALRRCRCGVAALEFGLIAPVFALAVAALLEMTMMMFVSALLEGGLREAARFGITGFSPAGINRAERIRQIVAENTIGLIDMSTASVTQKIYPSFSDVGKPEPFEDQAPGNGVYDPGEPYQDINGNGQWDAKVNVTLRGAAFDPALTVVQTVPAFTNPVTGSAQTTLWYANNSPVPLLNAPAASWKGCVYARYIDNAAADDDADVLEGDYSSPAGDWVGWEPIGPEGEPVPGFGRCSSAIGFSKCTPCLSHGITPPQSTKQGILDAVKELVSPQGTTDVPRGLAWAWRVLTPPKPFDEADPNPPGRRQQAIVLLTDGENVGGSGDAYKGVFDLNSAAQPALDNRLRLLAANIQGRGGEDLHHPVRQQRHGYAAASQGSGQWPGVPLLQLPPDAATLQQIFREVANHLSELRLSK